MRLTTKGRFAVTAMIDLALRSNNGPVALAASHPRHLAGALDAAACDKLANNTKASGKKCKNVCNKGDCNSGCFNKYMVGESIDYLASTYQCN